MQIELGEYTCPSCGNRAPKPKQYCSIHPGFQVAACEVCRLESPNIRGTRIQEYRVPCIMFLLPTRALRYFHEDSMKRVRTLAFPFFVVATVWRNAHAFGVPTKFRSVQTVNGPHGASCTSFLISALFRSHMNPLCFSGSGGRVVVPTMPS